MGWIQNHWRENRTGHQEGREDRTHRREDRTHWREDRKHRREDRTHREKSVCAGTDPGGRIQSAIGANRSGTTHLDRTTKSCPIYG